MPCFHTSFRRDVVGLKVRCMRCAKFGDVQIAHQLDRQCTSTYRNRPHRWQRASMRCSLDNGSATTEAYRRIEIFVSSPFFLPSIPREISELKNRYAFGESIKIGTGIYMVVRRRCDASIPLRVTTWSKYHHHISICSSMPRATE